jgi:hypothetical protein
MPQSWQQGGADFGVLSFRHTSAERILSSIAISIASVPALPGGCSMSQAAITVRLRTSEPTNADRSTQIFAARSI